MSSRLSGRPARSRACGSLSQVSRPKPTGTPVFDRDPHQAVGRRLADVLEVGVSPRMTTPRATTASYPALAACSAATGSSNEPGTRTTLKSVTPDVGQRALGAGDQGVGHRRVPLGRDHGDPDAFRSRDLDGGCSAARHQSAPFSSVPVGRWWPIRSRLVRRYRRLCSVGSIEMPRRSTTSMP